MDHSRNHICIHPKITLSYPEHEFVCTSCGLITEKSYFNHAQIVDEVVEGEIQVFLRDLLSNLNIPLGVLDSTFYNYQRLRHDERLSRFNNTTVATFALFDVMNEESMYKSEHELCYFAGINPNKLWSVQKSLNYEPRVPHIVLIDRIAKALEFPFFLTGEVLSLVERIQETCLSRAETIIACDFYHFILERSLNISVKRIALSSNVSKSTILHLFKKLQSNNDTLCHHH